MPEGSLTLNITSLTESLSGIVGLLGQAPEAGRPGSGLAGAADLAAIPLNDRFRTLEGELTQQISQLFQYDAAAVLGGLTTLFANLKIEVQSLPTQALQGFEQRITAVGTVFADDFVQRFRQALEAVRRISEGVPQNRTAIVSALLDQILGVLASLDGPEAEKVKSWLTTLQEMHRSLLPLIEQVQGTPDSTEVVIKVFQRTLDSTISVFGYTEVKRLWSFLEDFASKLVPQDLLNNLNNSLATTMEAYATPLTLVEASFPEFREAIVTAGDAIQELKQRVRRVLRAIRRILAARIFQPRALENFLREKLESALAIRIQEAQKIDDPFNDLFNRIDEAIAGINLESVRTEVLGFLEQTRTTLEQVNISSMADTLRQQLGSVQGTVVDLEQGVAHLTDEIKGFFDDSRQRLRALAGNIGVFTPEGAFQYNFGQEFQSFLTSANLAVGGDPDNPDTPSVAGALNEFKTLIEQFLSQLSTLLQPVEASLAGVKTTAVQGINDFSSFLTSLNIPKLMEQLRKKVEEILDAMVPLDFDLVVDPVIAEIEENTEKLRSIDTESLNDLLREALKIALDVIISIDFTLEISTPLKEQFASIKAIPQQAIDQLQRRYEKAIDLLNKLKPEQFLAALLSAFDIIDQAVSAMELTTILEPLDQWHQEYLQEPLDQLKPSTLLQPVSQAFQEITAVFGHIDGATLIEPLSAKLDDVKSTFLDFDITGWINDLLAAVARVKQDIRDIRPSELMEPLIGEFARLEEALDHFKPSVVFQPAVELAEPLRQFLENIEQQAIEALHEMFQAPLQVLDRLQPESLQRHLEGQIDAVIAALHTVNFPALYNQIKGSHFDLTLAVQAQGDQRRVAIAALIDPEDQMGELARTYNALVAALEGLKQNLRLTNLTELYNELKERLFAMLPPFARVLLDTETFKRVMRLADPTRFLAELDERFETLKNRLMPIRPQDLTVELDETYDTVLNLVEELDIEESLNQVKELLQQVKGIVEPVRIDFVAADMNRAVGEVRAMIEALNPARLATELDVIHQRVQQVVADTLPSRMLADLQGPLDQAQKIISDVDPRRTLKPPLEEAWVAVQDALDDIDFTVVLSPLVAKFDELEKEFEASLRRTENAFDTMLLTAKSALGGGAGVSAGVSLG